MATVTVAAELAAPPSCEESSGRHQQKHDVITEMVYYDGSPVETIKLYPDRVEGSRPKVDIEVKVRDIAGEEDKYTIEKNGFQWFKSPSKIPVEYLYEEDKITTLYYAEVEEFLKEKLGAKKVKIFDYKVRTGGNGYEMPLFRVHVDQSYDGAELMLRRHCPDADELIKGHWQIYNIWRPIKPVLTDPLGMMDPRTSHEEDFYPGPIEYIETGVKVETWMVKHAPRHSWVFKYHQKPDEVILFKCFDSDQSPGTVRRTPHSAFKDPAHTTEKDGDRHSIECRCLVFF